MLGAVVGFNMIPFLISTLSEWYNESPLVDDTLKLALLIVAIIPAFSFAVRQR